jgi:hypothetical protein
MFSVFFVRRFSRLAGFYPDVHPDVPKEYVEKKLSDQKFIA